MNGYKAIPMTPNSDDWCVVIYREASGSSYQDHAHLAVNLPCQNYEHAAAVARAYNAGGKS